MKKKGAFLELNSGTSRTLSENHTTRPNALSKVFGTHRHKKIKRQEQRRREESQPIVRTLRTLWA